MSIAALMMLIPPPLPPAAWRPDRFPEYQANCHVVDKEGGFLSGRLVVSGQGDVRRVELDFPESRNWPKGHAGHSVATVANPVTDGTYSYFDYLPLENNLERFGVVLSGLGPDPKTLTLKISGPVQSPVFEEPGLTGLCVTTSMTAGSRFILSDELQVEPQ